MATTKEERRIKNEREIKNAMQYALDQYIPYGIKWEAIHEYEEGSMIAKIKRFEEIRKSRIQRARGLK